MDLPTKVLNVSVCNFFDISKSLISLYIYTKNNTTFKHKGIGNLQQAGKVSHRLMRIIGKGPYQAKNTFKWENSH